MSHRRCSQLEGDGAASQKLLHHGQIFLLSLHGCLRRDSKSTYLCVVLSVLTERGLEVINTIYQKQKLLISVLCFSCGCSCRSLACCTGCVDWPFLCGSSYWLCCCWPSYCPSSMKETAVPSPTTLLDPSTLCFAMKDHHLHKDPQNRFIFVLTLESS